LTQTLFCDSLQPPHRAVPPCMQRQAHVHARTHARTSLACLHACTRAGAAGMPTCMHARRGLHALAHARARLHAPTPACTHASTRACTNRHVRAGRLCPRLRAHEDVRPHIPALLYSYLYLYTGFSRRNIQPSCSRTTLLAKSIIEQPPPPRTLLLLHWHFRTHIPVFCFFGAGSPFPVPFRNEFLFALSTTGFWEAVARFCSDVADAPPSSMGDALAPAGALRARQRRIWACRF